MEKKLVVLCSNFIREILFFFYFRYILIFNLQMIVQIKKLIKKYIRRNEIKFLNFVVELLFLLLVLIKVVIYLYLELIKKRILLILEFMLFEIVIELCVVNEDCFVNLLIYWNFFLYLLLNCNLGMVLDGWVCLRRYFFINRIFMVKGIKMIDLCSM